MRLPGCSKRRLQKRRALRGSRAIPLSTLLFAAPPQLRAIAMAASSQLRVLLQSLQDQKAMIPETEPWQIFCILDSLCKRCLCLCIFNNMYSAYLVTFNNSSISLLTFKQRCGIVQLSSSVHRKLCCQLNSASQHAWERKLRKGVFL